ncbi:MAG: hypothetical protein L6Q70_14090 [Thauera sp.]|nr:hypothetical protein [Thauera sp.]
MTVQRVLTGITTSGTPHLGNYAGAIRPAVAASRQPGVESFYFLADYHALIKTTDPLRVQRSTLEIAATWLAAGLRATWRAALTTSTASISCSLRLPSTPRSLPCPDWTAAR